MIPGLVHRTQAKNVLAHEPLHLAALVADLAGQAFLFTAEKSLTGGIKLRPYANIHVAVGERIQPVEISHGTEERVRVFFFSESAPLPFAAALAAVAGMLAGEEIKLDYLHIFAADDCFGALLCQQYYHIPYIYSVYNLTEEKKPLTHLHALGLQLPADCALLGNMFFNEQACAANAAYVIDESGGSIPQNWNHFFCSYAGRVVTGQPAVDTTYWADYGDGQAKRSVRKTELLTVLKQSANVLVYSDVSEAEASLVLPADTILLHSQSGSKRREILQSADFYIYDSPTAAHKQLLEAMAAGCIPISALQGIPAGLIVDESDDPDRATGYTYSPGEKTWVDALARAARDLRERPAWQQSLRQRGTALVAGHYSLANAAGIYHRVYRGFAPVKLPFLVNNQHKAQTAPDNGGQGNA
ncbi:MAG: hypothetical protein SCK29_04910 [Bacillota bacterium]|nr:hypothetical protein [Bacillota bacterium]MDW7683445.1 hypothetical protein [Bacillota bacterium]